MIKQKHIVAGKTLFKATKNGVVNIFIYKVNMREVERGFFSSTSEKDNSIEHINRKGLVVVTQCFSTKKRLSSVVVTRDGNVIDVENDPYIFASRRVAKKKCVRLAIPIIIDEYGSCFPGGKACVEAFSNFRSLGRMQ